MIFHLIAYRPSEREDRAATQVRNMEAGTETEAMEGGCLLAFCPWLFILLPCTSKDHQLRGDIAHSGLDLLTSINNQEKAPPRTSLEADVVKTFSQLKVHLCRRP